MPSPFPTHWLEDIGTHAQIIPLLGGFGPFETMTGGEVTRSMLAYQEPGGTIPRVIPQLASISDITITRAYVRGRDDQLLKWWKDFSSRTQHLTLYKQYVSQFGIVEHQEQYVVLMKSVKTPDARAGDNSISEVQVTLSVEEVM